MMQQQNIERLQQAKNSIDTLYTDMKSGQMSVEDFKYLQDNQETVLQLTQISSKQSSDQFNNVCLRRGEELQAYRQFITDTSHFWSVFSRDVNIKGLLH